jgi:hypothetical protein
MDSFEELTWHLPGRTNLSVKSVIQPISELGT